MAESAPFFWSGSGEKLSPEAIKRRRQIAASLAKGGSDYSPVQHWSQGLARVAQALVGGYEDRQLDKAEKANTAADAGIASSLVSQLFGGGAAAPASPVAAASPAAPSMAGDGAARTMAMPNVAPEVKDGIVQTASALGISPVDLATAISYETAGTFDPTKAGPTTQWGQHRGLIQFGEPQAKQFGVDWNNPVGSQLGPNGAVAAYLKNAGVQPGMGMMDIYSAINAGGVGRYGASDANNGGAPGTVADKVNNQMAGHRAKAQALFADMPAPGAAPVSMETGAPGFAIPGQPASMSGATFNAISAAEPVQPVFQSEGIAQPWMGTAAPAAPQVAQAPMPPARPTDLAMPQADMPAPGAVPAIGQMPMIEDLSNSPDAGSRTFAASQAQGGSPFGGIAQALMGGGQAQTASAPTVAPPQNVAPTVSPAVAQVAQALSSQPSEVVAQALVSDNPAIQRIAGLVLQQRLESQSRPQWIEQRLDDGSIAQRNSQTGEVKVVRPGVDPLVREGQRLDVEQKRRAVGEVKAPNVQRIKQPDGSEVAVQWDQTSGQWVPLKAPEGGNAVRPPPGKLTEAQSKDLVYFNRGVQALESFEKDAGAYASGIDRFASGVPGGNYVVSEQFQRAQQSGRNFLASILRKDTGAAITAQEEKQYGEIFLPQPGDMPSVLAQKQAARMQAIEAIKGGLGTAEVLARASEALRPAAPSGQTKSGVKWSVE